MAICANCGGRNRIDARFCNQCGHRLYDAICPPIGYGGRGSHQETCRKCDGSRRMDCTRCGGSGKLMGAWRIEDCRRCNTTGKEPCDECHGRGKVSVRD